MKAEKFIEDYTRNCSNIEYTQGVYAPSYHPWLTPDDALSAVEIAREEMLDEVCTYITDKMIQSGYTSQTVSKFVNKLFDRCIKYVKEGKENE